MFLMYYLNEKGERIYTLAVSNESASVVPVLTVHSPQKRSPDNLPTASAHPARFSPEDSYSRQRLIIKKRFGLLITQKPEPVY